MAFSVPWVEAGLGPGVVPFSWPAWLQEQAQPLVVQRGRGGW